MPPKRKKVEKNKSVDTKEAEVIVELPSDYEPVVFKLPNLEKDIFETKVDPRFASSIDYPKFSLGFHHFIHQSKDKTEIFNQFKGKKRVYLVMNQFERNVDNYNRDIGSVSKEFFALKSKPDILSRAFYKLWELLFMYDLVPNDSSNFVSAHLAEGPGSFIQATMFYREMFSSKSKDDKYYAVTLHSEDAKKHVPELEKNFVKFYEKEKPRRFNLHRTYTKQVAGGDPTKDNGDITDPKTIKLFGGNFDKKKADFVTADGGFDWNNENTQEQEAFKLIFAQIVMALKIQAKGGHFVCKFFETFTETSMRMICILSSFYEEVHAVKPLMSRQSNSEKYIVCRGFKYDDNDKERKKRVETLESVLKTAKETDGLYLVDVFPDFVVPLDYQATITRLNTDISNRQLVTINKMIDFINKQNYRGTIYTEHREEQIKASQYWIESFFPEKSQYAQTKQRSEVVREQISNKSSQSAARLHEILRG